MAINSIYSYVVRRNTARPKKKHLHEQNARRAQIMLTQVSRQPAMVLREREKYPTSMGALLAYATVT